jgi:hypothetical protein
MKPLPRTTIYYPELSEKERLHMSYHFDCELPQGYSQSYEKDLWAACVYWNAANLHGAHFYQFAGKTMTMLVDGRDVTAKEPLTYLLSGAGHSIYHYLRQAHPLQKIVHKMKKGVFSPRSIFAVDDLYLLRVSEEMNAEKLKSPETDDTISSWLDMLDERKLVLEIDDRWIALAIDCTNEEDASRYGLTDLMRRLDYDLEIAPEENALPACVGL